MSAGGSPSRSRSRSPRSSVQIRAATENEQLEMDQCVKEWVGMVEKFGKMLNSNINFDLLPYFGLITRP